MKPIFPIVLLLLMACTGKTSDTSETGDTATLTQIDSPASGIDQQLPDEQLSVTDSADESSELDLQLEAISTRYTDASDTWHHVTISSNGYESGSEVTWYFDESLEPRYYKAEWSSEGFEGVTEFFIESNVIVCVLEKENDTETKWCLATGGVRNTWKENGETQTEPLSPDFGTNTTESMKQYLTALRTLLKENEVSAQSGTVYTIKKETTVDYGQEFVETVEVVIPRDVYDKLIAN